MPTTWTTTSGTCTSDCATIGMWRRQSSGYGIEKDDGKKRPIGKPCFEDKIVQRAVVMILEAIFDHDFYEFSHGFRKGHSQHQALDELREKCRKLHINWIVDADVSGFFDSAC